MKVICGIRDRIPFHASRFITSMASLAPPADVRGMTVLDRDKFQRTVRVPCCLISSDKISKALKVLKPCLLKMPKLQPVFKEESDERKVLLHPHKYEDVLNGDFTFGDVTWTDILLKYENWTSDDIFRAVLPEDSVGNVSGFSVVGHIIHLNLKAELLDYKFFIGQVLLDKYQPNIKTVVNKSEIIENKFRNFKMEHLAGEENYQVLVKENNRQYAFDYEKVFWNPRLSSEHGRLTNKVLSNDLVCDVFAGVGPFAIPMAKKGCEVHANDLNPDSYYWLCHNVKLNKADVRTYNMDGKDFIQTIVKRNVVDFYKSERSGNVHVLMNLPAIATTFLHFFNGLLSGESVSVGRPLIVHCYYFRKKDEKEEGFLEGAVVKDVSTVRVVAPNKCMMRVTYELSANVLFSSDEPPGKRIKLS